MSPANVLGQWRASEKALDCEPPHRNDDARLDNAYLGVEPARAIRHLGGTRQTIAATGRTRSGKTSRDRRDVDPPPRHALLDADLSEPPEQRLPRPAGKGTAIDDLGLPRRLP